MTSFIREHGPSKIPGGELDGEEPAPAGTFCVAADKRELEAGRGGLSAETGHKNLPNMKTDKYKIEQGFLEEALEGFEFAELLRVMPITGRKLFGSVKVVLTAQASGKV